MNDSIGDKKNKCSESDFAGPVESTEVLSFVGIVFLFFSLGCGALTFSFFHDITKMSPMHALGATIFVWMVSMLCVIIVLAAWLLCKPFSELMHTTAK